MATASALSAGGLGDASAPGESSTCEPARAPIWKKTPCRLCGVGCGLLVGIEGGRAVAVRGDPDSPVSKGLACAKGYFSVQALYAQDRIRRAVVRRDGRTDDVAIGEALDVVARRLRETITRYGKESVALYGSAQWALPDGYIASRLFRDAIGTDHVETSSGLYGAAASTGLASTFGLDGPVGCYEDIEHADVIVLWDTDLAETDPVLFSRMLERRRVDPAVRIVDVTTRTTRTSHGADQSLLLAPHSVAAVASAICHELIERRWTDRAFVERHVAFRKGREGLGYGLPDGALVEETPIDATWEDYVASLATSTPERAQRRSGLPVERVRWLASLYGDRTRKVLSVWGGNVNRHARGAWLNNTLYNLHLLTGKVAAPGNGALALIGQPGGGNAAHDARPQTPPPRPARPVLELFRALERGDIRFLWIQATNPMLSLPNLDRYRRAAERGDRFLVVSEAYPTPTTEVADVVLPTAIWIEREGIYANAERRLQHFDAMVAPPGDAMSDGWQLIEVARRLGFATAFPWPRRTHVKEAWEEYRRSHDDPRSALPSFAQLKTSHGTIWPVVEGHETRWRYNSEHDPAAHRARGEFDFYGHPDGRAWIWLRPDDPPAEVPARSYPFWFRTGSVLEHWGGGALTQRIPTLHRAMPRTYLEMHRDDAQQLGVADGERVRVVSRRGSIEIEVRLDFRSQPPRGLLFAPSFDETVPVNRLLLDSSCPISGQPEGTTCAVRVERIPAEATR